MGATIFSAWIYDTLKPYAQQLSMGHPAKMKAITAGKNKSDRIDARMIADLLRCNLLPACYAFGPFSVSRFQLRTSPVRLAWLGPKFRANLLSELPMFENLLNHHWLVATSLLFFMALAGELGYRIGIKSHIEDDQNRKEQINALGSSLFILLSLLLSFALTMAVSRYDQRRELVVREADAIGTTYLRAAILRQPYQQNFEQLLRSYVDARIDFFAAGVDPAQLEQAMSHTSSLQQELWKNMVAVSQSDRTPTAVVAFMNSLNEVIDLDSQRVAALENRIPQRVWMLITMVALIAVFARGLTLKRRFWLTLVLGPMTIAIAVGLIADVDSPRSGFIQVDQGPLYRLKAEIQPK